MVLTLSLTHFSLPPSPAPIFPESLHYLEPLTLPPPPPDTVQAAASLSLECLLPPLIPGSHLPSVSLQDLLVRKHVWLFLLKPLLKREQRLTGWPPPLSALWGLG